MPNDEMMFLYNIYINTHTYIYLYNLFMNSDILNEQEPLSIAI